MKWIIISAVWYFVGMLCFYHMADFSVPAWTDGYYLWDKTKDVLFAGAIVFNVPRIGKSFVVIFYFCIIRLAWEIVAITINSDINNSKVIDWLFILFLISWIYQLVREWRKLK